MMRIAFLTFEFPDARPGGVGSYVFKCARAIAAAGHEPHVFTINVGSESREMVPAGVFLHEVDDVAARVEKGTLPRVLGAAALRGSGATYKLGIGALLCDALRTEHAARPFDVVEAAECEGLALPLVLRPIPKLPVVVQIHLGYAVNAFGNSVDPAERDELAEALELASIVGADAVCAATASVVEVTKKLCPFDREVTIVPHPVEVRAGPQPTPAPKGGPVLFVGRLQRRKGCDVLAGAADIFLRRNPQATVRVAGGDTRLGRGRGSMLAEMIDRVDPSVRDRFIYLGELSQARLRREIEGCSFGVVPSVVENFANTAVDAMAGGRLVIYGGNTGLDEVVGEAGMRVWPLTAENLAEKMHAAWNDGGLAQEFGRRGLERVGAKFDAAKITRERVEFYQKVISEHRDSGRRQWEALSGKQIRAVLDALVGQMSGALGLENGGPTPGSLLLDRLSELSLRLKRPPRVWLFGAGRFTMRLLGERYLWESRGLGIAGIIDEHPRFERNPDYLGLKVRSPHQLISAIKAGEGVDAIILSTDTLEEVLLRRAQCFVELGISVVSLSITKI